jgi:hypothetical protein
MAYEVKKSNGEILTISNNAINTETSLQLIGKSLLNYGDPIAENFVHLLENFSHDTPPVNPTSGQLFYNNSEGNLKDGIREGRWKYYTGTEWIDLANATILIDKWKDTSSVVHTVTLINDVDAECNATQTIAVVSSEDFTLHATDDSTEGYRDDFPDVVAGITLAPGMKFHGTATSAEYADVAEYYTSDVEYESGTILELGGTAEVTQTDTDSSTNVFGVVSTNPAYLMNTVLMGTKVAVALVGRVPCKVTGIVKKGDRLVSSDIAGVARAATVEENTVGIHWSQVIGRSLENKSTDTVDLIEVIIGNR